MTEKKEVRLRPLQTRDVEAVAAYEREIAKISFPDDPITDLDFYIKKVKKLIDDRNAATFVADDGSDVVGWAYVSKRQNFITKETYADFHSIFVSPSQRGTDHREQAVPGGVRLLREPKARPRRVPHPRDQRADEGGAGAGRFCADADFL